MQKRKPKPKQKPKRTLHASFKDRMFELPPKNRVKNYFLISASALVVIFVLYLIVLSTQLPSLEQLERYEPELTTKIYSADGKVIKEFFTRKRFLVPLENMPEYVWKSVIASEDHRFFSHWGIVPKRLVRAVWDGFVRMDTPRGTSTVTQQLARDLYLTLDKTISRKIKEVLTAIQIERTYTKWEILEMYLNQTYMGPGIYGMQSAARYYFGKDVQDVTLHEAALLTAILPNAGYYSPFRNPERALRRRNHVLYRMKMFDYITENDYQLATQTPLDVIEDRTETVDIAPYFTEFVRQKLVKKYGAETVFEGGLSVYTTLDTRAQLLADSSIQKHLPVVETRQRNWILSKPEKNFEPMLDPALVEDIGLKTLMADTAFVDSVLHARATIQVAFVAIDPSNGNILAMAGGRDFEESEFNRAVQANRQPGSVFKPFAYVAAIDNGYPTTYELMNQPVPVDMPDGSRWTPPNYDGSIGGKTTLREGLYRSLNRVAARLIVEDVVPAQVVVNYAQRLGISTPLIPVHSIALGSLDVIPIEVVSAYGAFANRGVLVEPIAILSVIDKHGNVLEDNQATSREVLKEETAYIITDMMKSVLSNRRGTGRGARTIYGFTRPAAGKTGTTNDFSDAWFVGFTPQIVAGVWVGVDNRPATLGNRQSGAFAALPIWARFMKAVHDSLQLPEKDFVQPDGVVRLEICAETKKLATESCPEILEEVFLRQYQPTEYCDKHGILQNNTRTRKRLF